MGVFVFGKSFFVDFLAMFIGAKIKDDVFSEEAVEAGEDVGLDDFESKADVRLGIDIRKGGGEVVVLRGH